MRSHESAEELDVADLADGFAPSDERSGILEGRLEHASPDVDAEEVREHVDQLREELPA